MPQLSIPTKPQQQQKKGFDLATRETPEWLIIDSEELPRNQASVLDETLPTMAKEPQPQLAIHLLLAPNLLTLCSLLTELLTQVQVNLPEVPPSEPEIPLTPT